MDLFINKLVESKPYKVIISNKTNKENEFNKIVITLKLIKNAPMYQIEKFTETQAFHVNINETDLNVRAKAIKLLEENIGVNLCDFGLSNVIPKEQVTKEI